MPESSFAITQATDWPMLVAVGGISWLLVNFVLFALLGIIYKTLPKKGDLFLIQQSVQNDLRSSMSLVAERFERALDKHHDQTEHQRDKEFRQLRDDFREWREWHNTNCPVANTHKEWIARHITDRRHEEGV